MTDDDVPLPVLIAVGLSAADIVEDPLPLATLAGGAPDRGLQIPQPSLAELIVDAENDVILPVANLEEMGAGVNLAASVAGILPTPDSDNYATAIVDSPFDTEWLFTTPLSSS
jgi:hypothetical protein